MFFLRWLRFVLLVYRAEVLEEVGSCIGSLLLKLFFYEVESFYIYRKLVVILGEV